MARSSADLRAEYEHWRGQLGEDRSFQNDLDRWQVLADQGQLPVDDGSVEERLARYRAERAS